MPIEPEAELQAVEQAQNGWRGALMEFLAPLQRPMLTLFICNALEGKKAFNPSRIELIGAHVQSELAQRPGEKKVIEGELAIHYKVKPSYVRRCHERVIKSEKSFQKALDWVKAHNQSHNLP